MPRFKHVNYAQGLFIPVQFEHQVLPGTFEHTLSYVVDHHLDLSVFNSHYDNDTRGATAFDPRVLLKIVLFAYSRGILSSRDIALACEQNIVFMALSANTRPHFTSIASFISSMGDAIEPLFRDVLLYCDELGLIGKEMFAIDGCKISSNASKEWSGTREDFERKKVKFEESIAFLLGKHKAEDESEEKTSGPKNSGPKGPGTRRDKEKVAIEHLKAKIAKLDQWLKSTPDKLGVTGKPTKSNITDPDSAKMATSHGVVQGYNGVAVVDDKHQIIVTAEAVGSGSEVAVLNPALEKTRETFQSLGEENIFEKVTVTADSGFHSEKNMKELANQEIDAYVGDRGLRQRDPRFDTAQRHKNTVEQWKLDGKSKFFKPRDFVLNPATGQLTCPAGKTLTVQAKNFRTPNGFLAVGYRAKAGDCGSCGLRDKCLRVPTAPFRQVYKFQGRETPPEESFTKKMIKKMDSLVGRYLYSRRMGTVEPVFANLRHMLGLDRFTMRGITKVTTQWKLYAFVHNLFKIQRYGYAAG